MGILSEKFGQKKHWFSVFTILILGSSAFFSADAQQVRELNSYLEAEDFSSSDPFMDLLYGSGGIVEVRDGSIVLPRASSPRNILLNGSDVSVLSGDSEVFAGIEFMQIKLGQGERFSLDYGSLSGFGSLRYILVTGSDPLSSDLISQMLSGFSQTDILIFYQVSRPG